MQEIWTASSGEIPWNAPGPLVVDEISRAEAVGPSVEKQRKGIARISRATRSLTGSQQDRRRGIVLVRKWPSSSEQDRHVRCLETRTPQTWCCRAVEKGDESAKPKEYFSWKKPGHSKGEYRYFSAENVSPIRGSSRVTKRDLSQLQIPQHECWHSESRRRVRSEKRDEANRCCWTADRRRSGSATERS